MTEVRWITAQYKGTERRQLGSYVDLWPDGRYVMGLVGYHDGSEKTYELYISGQDFMMSEDEITRDWKVADSDEDILGALGIMDVVES